MFGNEVRFKIGGDVTQLERSFSRAERVAERSGQRMEATMRKAMNRMRGPGEGDDDLKRRMAADAAIERRQEVLYRIAQQRKKITWDEASTVGRIKIVTNDLAMLARRRAKEEEGSVGALKLQLQIEEKMATLRRLRQTQAKANLAQSGTGTATPDAGDGGWMGRMKVSLQSLIVRAVGGAITMGLGGLLGRQRAQQQIADAQVDSTGAALGSMREKFAAIGGLRGQLSQGQARSKDLARDLQTARDREKFLTDGALMQGIDFLTKMGLAPDELTKTQEKIQQINAEIQRQGDANDLVSRELKRQTESYDNQINSIQTVQVLREKGLATEAKLREVEADRLDNQLRIERKYGTPESVRAVEAQRAENQNATIQARIEMQQRRRDVNQQLATDAAEGRTFANGQRRPRSEAERLAQRAAQYRERARNLVLTNGRSGSTGAGDFIAAAMRDEASVGERFSAASRGVPRDRTSDASSLKPDVLKAFQILSSIDQSLRVVEVGDIIRK